MPEYEVAKQKKQQTADKSRRTGIPDFQPISQNLLAWDISSFLKGENTFDPAAKNHLAILSATSGEQRINLFRKLQQTYGNKYVQRLIRFIDTQSKQARSTTDVYEHEADPIVEEISDISNSDGQGTATQRKMISITERKRPSGSQQQISPGPFFSPISLRLQQEYSSDLPIMLQRQRRRRGHAESFRQQVFAVRDRSISSSDATLVQDLAEFKQQVMRLRNHGEWTLVLAIHGSQERLGAQAPPRWQDNAIFYNAATINQLFSLDPRWVRWRDRYGPTHLSLTSCQVSVSFERTIIENLTRHSASGEQSAQGLGEGCKPYSTMYSLTTAAGRPLRSRRQYQRLPARDRQALLQQLKSWNRKYGYYGAPPVPEDRILDYYFDEVPKANWVIVEIGKGPDDAHLQNTHIPFWNRATGPDSARFHQICDQGVAPLRPHQPGVPPLLGD